MPQFSISQYPNQHGKIAIVTGANSGVGLYTAKGLGQKGVHVVMACRNMEKAAFAKTKLEQWVPGGSFEIAKLDTSSLSSVSSFVGQFHKTHKKLDYLINNAGIMAVPESHTSEGYELQFATNYLGHFALTAHLLTSLKLAKSARVISLSSIAHKRANIYFDNVHFEHGYEPMKAYGQSKLADLIFSYALDRRLKSAKLDVISLAAHPGVSNTNLGNKLPWPLKLMMPLFSVIGHSPEKAANPSLMAALDPSLKGGEYIGPKGFKELSGDPGIVKSTRKSHDEAIAVRLWSLSEKLTKMSFRP